MMLKNLGEYWSSGSVLGAVRTYPAMSGSDKSVVGVQETLVLGVWVFAGLGLYGYIWVGFESVLGLDELRAA